MRGDSYTSSKDFHHELHPPNNAVLRLSSLDHDVSRHSTTSVTALLSFHFVSFHTHTLLPRCPRCQAHLRLPQISPTTSIIIIISIIIITPIPPIPHPLTSPHPHPPPHHLPFPPPAPPAVSSPNTLLAAMNLHPRQPPPPSIHPSTRKTSTQTNKLEKATHAPAHQPPNPLTYSACTAVMPSRFSMSARWAFSCARCACRCVYCLLRWRVVVEGAVVGGGVVAAEGRWGWWVEGRSAVDMVDGSLLGGLVAVTLSGSRLRLWDTLLVLIDSV